VALNATRACALDSRATERCQESEVGYGAEVELRRRLYQKKLYAGTPLTFALGGMRWWIQCV